MPHLGSLHLLLLPILSPVDIVKHAFVSILPRLLGCLLLAINLVESSTFFILLSVLRRASVDLTKGTIFGLEGLCVKTKGRESVLSFGLTLRSVDWGMAFALLIPRSTNFLG